jgi:NAD(P)-dependent dehydrogenase (short-subunit alcohol dehydrogenase family)
MRLKDKVAIITGGGRGIGRDIVLAYALQFDAVADEIKGESGMCRHLDAATGAVRPWQRRMCRFHRR